MTRDECEHGSLRRSCEIYELEAEIVRLAAELKQERDRNKLTEAIIRENEALTKENMRLRGDE